ncbi:type III effector [Pseudomonas syringae]|nr:type III effector [Pseudomonas syringae]
MGNICVGGSRMSYQVNSPDRASNNSNDDNDVSSGQLLNVRHALADAAGLTREQHAFISNDAPASLRSRHNALYSQTQNTFHMADMQHRYMTGESGISPGMRPHQNVSEMRRAISDWNDMREALQHAMDIHADMPESPERYVATINPSGPPQMSTLSPSPYRNW